MGLFKGNLTAAVGSLYPTEIERDLSLSRLYWAVNLGALPAGVAGGSVSYTHLDVYKRQGLRPAL